MKSTMTFVRNALALFVAYKVFISYDTIQTNTMMKFKFRASSSLIGLDYVMIIEKDWPLGMPKKKFVNNCRCTTKRHHDNMFRLDLNEDDNRFLHEHHYLGAEFEMTDQHLSCFFCTFFSFVGAQKNDMLENSVCSFENHSVELGSVIYSTMHACSTLDLFVAGTLREISILGIDRIGGTSAVAKLGSIQLENLDD